MHWRVLVLRYAVLWCWAGGSWLALGQWVFVVVRPVPFPPSLRDAALPAPQEQLGAGTRLLELLRLVHCSRLEHHPLPTVAVKNVCIARTRFATIILLQCGGRPSVVMKVKAVAGVDRGSSASTRNTPSVPTTTHSPIATERSA